jgi:hypothetical protein
MLSPESLMLSPERLMLSPERRTRRPFPGDAASTVARAALAHSPYWYGPIPLFTALLCRGPK